MAPFFCCARSGNESSGSPLCVAGLCYASLHKRDPVSSCPKRPPSACHGPLAYLVHKLVVDSYRHSRGSHTIIFFIFYLLPILLFNSARRSCITQRLSGQAVATSVSPSPPPPPAPQASVSHRAQGSAFPLFVDLHRISQPSTSLADQIDHNLQSVVHHQRRSFRS